MRKNIDATVFGGNALTIRDLIEILSVSFHLSHKSYNNPDNW